MQLLLTNAKNCEELVTCVAEVLGAAITPNKLIAYVGVLEKIPMPILQKVAGRILETRSFMPLPAVWREIASAIYGELEREQRASRRRLEAKVDPAKRLTPENLREYMEERAQAGNDDPVATWCQAMLETFRRGKPATVQEMLLGGIGQSIPPPDEPTEHPSQPPEEQSEKPEEAEAIPF